MRVRISFGLLGLFAALAPALRADPNPIFPGADPHAAVIGTDYWIYPTGGDQLRAYSSADLSRWQDRGTIFRLTDARWAQRDRKKRSLLWAPAILQANNRFYLYYSVGPQTADSPSRIGVAVSNSPQGPFRDSGRPLLTGGRGFEAIDPMVFIDPKTKTPYLYAGGSAGAKLRVFKLKPNLIEIDQEVAVETPPEFTEGAFLHENNGIYYLSYSHGSWNNSSYSVHYATARTPTGPWEYRGCILRSDDRHQGPGHHSFVQNPRTREWFIVYHRWETTNPNGPYHGARQVAIERLEYEPDGAIKSVRMTDAEVAPSALR